MRSSLTKAFSLRGAPTEAIDNIIASLAPATLKQYATALKTWWQFRQIHNENYYFPDTSNVVRLLNQEFKKGASYESLNTLRSAISLISKEKIGEDPLISRFLRGSFKLKPSNPKYDYTWDVNIVLLKNLPPLRKPPDQEKYQPLLKIPIFKNNQELCVATKITHYLTVTKNLRKNKEDKLFIACIRPHKPVTSETLSRWIKNMLKKSGIDTDVFTGHSTRHEASSTAYSKGIDLHTIRRTIGWSDNSQVFAKFYSRPIVNDRQGFAKFIINCT